ncbi:MAG: hypothetical protein MJ230_02585 [bacterium]|nr:hypothetical protein [bacterium]
MGMDGLSMANTGTLKESTSAEYSNRTEQVIQSDPSNNSKQVQNLETNRAVREKNEEDDGQKKNKNQKQQEEFQDGLVEEKPKEDYEEFNIEDLDNPNKNFYVRLNTKDDIIELYDSSSDKLIETITGTELQNLVKKLNMASGIFVNKKV